MLHRSFIAAVALAAALGVAIADAQAFVGSDRSNKFTYTDAQMSRSGAQIEKFQTDAITVPPEKLVGIKVHLKKVGSSIEITSRP